MSIGPYVPPRGRFEDPEDVIDTVRHAFDQLVAAGRASARAARELGDALRKYGWELEVNRLQRRARFLKRYQRRGLAMRRAR